jgi:hypothetical protein
MTYWTTDNGSIKQGRTAFSYFIVYLCIFSQKHYVLVVHVQIIQTNQMGEKINYIGKVYVYSSGMPEEAIELSKKKLCEYGVNRDDIVVIELPEGVPEGSLLATVWPHYVSIARVKKVKDGSIYAPQLFNINF